VAGVTDLDVVKWIYMIFAVSAGAMLFARGLAHWVEWPPWWMRIVSLVAAVVGLAMLWKNLGFGVTWKAFLIIGVIYALYIWVDLKGEKVDAEREAEQQKKLLR
jgi:hypothetical protein